MVEHKSSGIDPEKLGRGVIKKIFESGSTPETAAFLPVYRVRWWGYTKKWEANSFIIDVLGCNEDCAHCYVPIPLLRADIGSPEFKSKFEKLPKSLQDFPQNAETLIRYAINRFKIKYGTAKGGVIELNGGEPTLYPAAIRKMAEICQDAEATLGVNTNGFIIATQENFLGNLEGLENAISFMVSIKGTTPNGFRKFSGAVDKYYLTPFIAAKKIQDEGFRPARLGVTVDTIALPETMEEDIERFFELMKKFDLKPEMLVLDKITENILGHEFPTIGKMIRSGYYEKNNEKLIRHTNPKLVISRLSKGIVLK